MCDKFAEHFETISSVPENQIDSQDLIRKSKSLPKNKSMDNIRQVEIRKLPKILSSLHNKKACDVDCMHNEYLKLDGHMSKVQMCSI